MRPPLISIIITTYNYAHTVGTAIRSALAQDYPNLEVVVMDNASTDATEPLVATFAHDSRLRYHRNPENIGMNPNHNAGLRMSKGEYVCFLSADDFLMPGFVSRSYTFLRDHPEIDVRYGATYFVDAQERFSNVRQMAGQPLFPYAGGRNEFAALLAEGCYMCFPTMLMRRDLYERFGPLEEVLKAADYEIVLRWAEGGIRFAYDPEPVAAVRIHPEQQSSISNYVVDGGDIREVVALVRRYVRPDTETRVAGYEKRIIRHVRGKLVYASAFRPELRDDPELVKEIQDGVDLIEAVRLRNASRPRKSKPTVVVLAGPHLTPVAETLESLAAQTHADWEAVVVQSPGTSWAPLCRYADPQGRIRHVTMLTAVRDSVMLNQAIRIAGGDVLTFMRAGTVWPRDHLAKLVATFDRDGVEMALSRAVLAIDEPLKGLTSRRRVEMCYGLGSWPEPNLLRVAADVTLDAMAFRMAAYDFLDTGFHEGLPVFEDWEYALRLAAFGSFAPVDSEVEIRAILRYPSRDLPFGAFANVARAIHAAYPDRDEEEAVLRRKFVGDLELLVPGESGLADFYRTVSGMRLRPSPLLA